MIKIKPKDKVTLAKINLHNERLNGKEEIALNNYEIKILYDKYEVLLPNLSILETDGDSNNSIKYILKIDDVNFVFYELENIKLDKNSYKDDLNNNENIQILNNDTIDVIQYRKVEETTKFYLVKFYKFEKESDLIVIAKFSCNNNKSDEWKNVFLEIFNSIKEIDGADTKNERI